MKFGVFNNENLKKMTKISQIKKFDFCNNKKIKKNAYIYHIDMSKLCVCVYHVVYTMHAFNISHCRSFDDQRMINGN